MVRYYILPNADHLAEEELNFELTLRNVPIELDAKLEDKRRALRYAYKKERLEPKVYDTGFSIVNEAADLEKLIKSLKKSLRESFDYVIVSRLRHYLIRLASSTVANEEEKELKDDCCKQIEEIMRAHRQRVTYDPEHSNDETDYDLGDGAKALKDSWRNPDPNALVRKGSQFPKTQEMNQEKNRTGATPKKKREIGEERRDFNSDTVPENRHKPREKEIETNHGRRTLQNEKEMQLEKTGKSSSHREKEKKSKPRNNVKD